MRYLKQFGLIIFISFIGEIIHWLIPVPVPASIYGIVLLFLALECKIIPVSAVKESSTFLIEIMPIMFIPAAVGLMNSWSILRSNLLAYVLITVISTLVVMVVSGKVTQAVIKSTKEGKKLK